MLSPPHACSGTHIIIAPLSFRPPHSSSPPLLVSRSPLLVSLLLIFLPLVSPLLTPGRTHHYLPILVQGRGTSLPSFRAPHEHHVSPCGCACGLVYGCLGWWSGMILQPASTIHTFSFTLPAPTPLAPSSSMGVLRPSVLSATTSDRTLSNVTSLFPYHDPFSHARPSSSFLGPPGLFPPSRSTPAVDQLRQVTGPFWWVSGVRVGPARTGTCVRVCVGTGMHVRAGMGMCRWLWGWGCTRVCVYAHGCRNGNGCGYRSGWAMGME